MDGVVAVWIAGVCLAVVTGGFGPAIGLVLVLAVLVPYLVLLGVPHERLSGLRLPAAWLGWIRGAIAESEVELEVAFHPRRGQRRDAIEALVATVVVVGASIVMELTGARIGTRLGWPELITGGLVLAAVTSIPNAVAAVYLASRGRGAATLSTAMNSNALNVAFGLLLPGAVAGGVGAATGPATFIAAAYLTITVGVLVVAGRAAGLRRGHGGLIIAAYLVFVAVLAVVA
jgi:Ca2+/Na+ antiporter